MWLFHDSNWTFETSAGAGLSIGPVAASGGMVRLKSPSGVTTNFYFGGLGGGASLSKIKIPKLPEIKLPSRSAAYSKPSNYSTGVVFRKSVFEGSELTEADFKGSCIYVEGGAGALIGVSLDLMFFGANQSLAMASVAAGPFGIAALLASSNGILIWGGVNQGPQIGAGIAALVGMMY